MNFSFQMIHLFQKIDPDDWFCDQRSHTGMTFAKNILSQNAVRLTWLSIFSVMNEAEAVF